MKNNAIIQSILDHKNQIRALGVGRLSVFGSVARGDFGPESDVDVVVDAADGGAMGLFRLARVADELERLLDRPVDVISRKGLEHTHDLKARIAPELIDVF
jgi:hypothetical protein